MTARLTVLALLAVLVWALSPQPVGAQGNPHGPTPPQGRNPPQANPPQGNPPQGRNPHAAPRATNPHWVEPSPEALRGRRGGPARSLEFLFGALKVAPDEDSAKTIEDRIWAQWLASGSDTVNLLMNRAKTAVEANELDLAVRLLDAVTEIRPQYAEAWNRRATVFFLKRDYGSAIVDLRKVLSLEPRHFGALAGLGMILQEIGEDKQALAVYRRATEVYPRLKGMDEKIKSLTEKVDGRDI